MAILRNNVFAGLAVSEDWLSLFAVAWEQLSGCLNQTPTAPLGPSRSHEGMNNDPG
jgi:hypothetical protein